jgi:hypothetical protein
MDITKPTLPTIHLNGTGADSLEREYRAVRRAIAAAANALQAATCNQRDFYPQHRDATGIVRRLSASKRSGCSSRSATTPSSGKRTPRSISAAETPQPLLMPNRNLRLSSSPPPPP